MIDHKIANPETCSGLHPDILENAVLDDTSPVIARRPSQNRGDQMLTCWLAYPGCNLEVYIENEVAVAFRRGDVYVYCRDHGIVVAGRRLPNHDLHECKYLDRAEFNRELYNNMKLAIEHVTTNADIVGTSRHFVDVFASLIDELEKITDEVELSDEVKERLNDLKVKAFSHLLSEDLRRG